MDVAIIECKECFFSREAESHITGIFDKLMREDKQKMDVALKSYDLKDLDHPTDRVVVHTAKVQIVIISRPFLQRMKDEASRRPRLSPINRVFRSKNVIAVLLAVTATEVEEDYESVLPRFREWFSVDLRSTNKLDPEFCKKFTEQVLKIYKVELSNSSNFSVFPKKVTREQPKIVISFKKCIEQNDEIRIELKTPRQMTTISDVRMENPHTTILRVPESLSPDREAIIDVSVFINNNKIGGSRIKSELNLKKFDEDEIDRMAKILPPFTNWLDTHISDSLMKHYKECTDYTSDPELELMNGIIICKGDILPTILHFASYYGLSKTAFIVLDEADGLAHCAVKNEIEETPSEIAFARGNTKIGQLIREYQEISNSYRAYRVIKELIEKDTGAAEEASEVTQGDDVPGDIEVFNEECGATSNGSDTAESNNVQYSSVSSEVSTAEEAQLESEQNSRSEEEDVEKRENRSNSPTPSTRYRRRREYVNFGGNPEENPEIVEHRPKRTIQALPDIQKKRQSMMPNYDIPRTRDQDYEVPPPEARPVPRKVTPHPVFQMKNPAKCTTDSGYLIMNDDNRTYDEPRMLSVTEEPVSENEDRVTTLSSATPEEPILRKPSIPNDITSKTSLVQPPINSNPRPISPSHRSKKPAVALDPSDQQLIELMEQYKNDTYDMHMIELLFENWKQRPDVQRSIEDKMKMIEKLREDYRSMKLTNKSTKKQNALDKIKTIFSIKRRKGSIPNVSAEAYPVQRKLSESGITNGAIPPAGLTFTGPVLPQHPFNSTVSEQRSPSPTNTQQPLPLPNHNQRIDSALSYRTSYDSRSSDSSSDSDRTSNELSTINRSTSFKAIQPPLEYHNPLDKRFFPSYVTPNPLPSTSSESSSSLTHSQEEDPAASYQVPPPPRPVKPPPKKPVPAIPKDPVTSPNLSHKPSIPERKISPVPLLSPKPPAVLEESSPPPVLLPKPSIKHEDSESIVTNKPPPVPAKPGQKSTDQLLESTSPPPEPPPRNQNTPNLFSYIDYKKKNEVSNNPGSTQTTSTKQSYENMGSETQGQSSLEKEQQNKILKS